MKTLARNIKVKKRSIRAMVECALAIALGLGFSLSAQAEPEWMTKRAVAETVQKFYSVYIHNLKKPAVQNQILNANLTPEFLRGFAALVESTDGDPMLKSEDMGADYKDKISVYNISVQSETSARADVKIGELPPGARSPHGPLRLRLTLKKIGGSWKIASVSRGFDN